MHILCKFLSKNLHWIKNNYKSTILIKTYGSMKVTVVGAAGKVGQPVCLMLKQSPLIDELCIHDIKSTSTLGLELNCIDTKCKVTSFSGKDSLQVALVNTKIVIVLASTTDIEFVPFEKMWVPNSVIIKEVMSEIARNSPKALVAIATEPINSIVPMACEILKKSGYPNMNGVLGITTLNTVRANTFVANIQGLQPEHVVVPIVGGHSPETVIPVLSQAKPCAEFTDDEIKDITIRLRNLKKNITRLKPEKSGPLVSAFAIARFVISLVKAAQGYPDVIECAYVSSQVHPSLRYLITPLLLGPNGLQKNLGLPKLNGVEQLMFDNVVPLLAREINKGERFAGVHHPSQPSILNALSKAVSRNDPPKIRRMDCDEFRSRGKDMIEYICNYLQHIETRRVTPNIEPGYLRKLIPENAPVEPEDWDSIMADVESKIMPGVTHWQHPRFHAYFPSGNSFPSILGDMLSDAIGCIGFSWAASPACTELETIVLDWLGKAIGLPDQFLAFKEGSRGGGVIQTSASECVLVSMLAARAQALKRLKQQHPFVEEGILLSKLMAYCSKESHSCVEKAAMISFVKLRILEPDEKSSLRGKTLMMAMEEDETMGLIPFFVSMTLGTTSCCSFDNLPEIGVVCQKFPCVWLHVDAAYAGNALICPELKYLLDGVEYADSFNTNPNKWLLTNFDCSLMWLGLVCFRLKGPDKLNEKLLSNINASGKLHMVPANVNEKYVIRFCVVSPDATDTDIDHAWEVICEFADELLESQNADKEQEQQDEVFELLERKKKETLAHKRSFFVRMVSDPKIYNPSIAKALPSTRRHLTQPSAESPENNITIQPPTSASWISWPLAFLFQGITEEGSSSDVPIRFRHLDTKVRLKASGKCGPSSPRQSPSPDGENSRSPKRSPTSSRKSSLINN